jgi:hypothetical protein
MANEDELFDSVDKVLTGNIWETALAAVLAGHKDFKVFVPRIASATVLHGDLRVRVTNVEGGMLMEIEYPDGESATEKLDKIKEATGVDLRANIKWHTE